MFLALLLSVAAQASPEAAALFRSGDRRAAVAMMAAELEARPDDRVLRRSLVECELALKAYERALEHAGDLTGEFVELRARALFFLARYDEALADLDPRDPDDVLLVVDALEALGRMAEVDAATEAAAEALGRDQAAVQVLFGRRAMRQGDWDAAVRHFRAAVERDPLDAAARFGLGRALVRAGSREEGLAVLAEHRRLLPLLDQLEFLQRSLDLEPTHAPNHAALGDVERELGRTDEARTAYETALALALRAGGPDVVPIALRYARFLHEDAGDGAEALAVLRRANDVQPDVRLLVRAGDVARSLGRLDRARELYTDALRLRPGDAAIRRRVQELDAAGGADR